MYWQAFDPEDFDYEFDEDELAGHSVEIDEAVEVLWNGFDVYRNKGYHGGYQLIGRTDSGRRLKLIVLREEPRPDSCCHRMGRMTTRKKTTPDEIERQLVADADNPDAWEPVATVGASRSPRPGWYGTTTSRASKGASRTASQVKKK